MTLRFPIVLQAAAIAAAAPFLSAAGEFPAAPAAAVHLIAAAGPATPIPDAPAADPAPAAIADDDSVAAPRPAELATLVADTVAEAPAPYGDRECLARAVYFEARGEPLEGQLAVAQVILNRVASGRYADTVCGVIAQPGQFSFSRSRTPADGRDWRIAKAIATIAATNAWAPMAPKAMAFHAVRINASWSMHKVGTIGNHVFYR
ncbi:MAG: cell wall hydrolase [Sphingomonadaceae bacterium]|nr:cell wall hydrolase [Sphingomonadaceae bacterium]